MRKPLDQWHQLSSKYIAQVQYSEVFTMFAVILKHIKVIPTECCVWSILLVCYLSLSQV